MQVRQALRPGACDIVTEVYQVLVPHLAVPLTMHTVVDSGQFGARAIAETLFGRNNPGGKLPYTFYKSSFISKISMDEFGCAKPPGTTLATCCWHQHADR